MRIPDAGPFGDTFREARVLAMVAASFLKRPSAGWVASVFTDATHRFVVLFAFGISASLPAYNVPVRLR